MILVNPKWGYSPGASGGMPATISPIFYMWTGLRTTPQAQLFAIEGSMMATALGAALGWQMQRTDRVAAVIVGDGTSGRGEWHESMNLAATWRVPLVYCCVNNRYAISTPVGYSHATADLVDFARAYKIPAVQVDGNDIEAAYEATRAAVEHMRAGQGPYFIEYKTWRWQGIFSGEFRAPMVVRTAAGGGFGGGPHHSQSVEGWFLNVPGLVIVAPSNPHDAKGLLLASIENDNPVLFLEHKALYRMKGEVEEEKYTVPLRMASIPRAGEHVTVVSSQRMTREALAAADELAGEGISVEVIDLRTLRPWDTGTVLSSVAKTGRVVVANEAPKIGGLASDASAVIAEEGFSHLKATILRVCGLDTPIPFSVPLEKIVLPGKDDIKAAVRKVVAL